MPIGYRRHCGTKVAELWSASRALGNGGAPSDRAPQSALLITICAGRSPAVQIDPARALASSERRGHTRAIPRDCVTVPRPHRLDIWLPVPSRCGGAWSAPPRHPSALLWPSGQPLWVASGSAGQSTLWQTRRFDGFVTDRPDGPLSTGQALEPCRWRPKWCPPTLI